MKLGTKLSLSLGLLTVFILMVGGIGILQMDKINNAATLLAEEWLPATVAIEELNTTLSDYRIAQVQHVFSTDPAVMADYEKKMAGYEKQEAMLIKKYESYPMSPVGERMYRKYQEFRKQYDGINDVFIKLSREGKTQDAIALLNGKGLEFYNETNATLGKIVAANVEGGQKAGRDGAEVYAAARTSILILLVVSVVVAIGISIVLIRNTLHMLGKDPAELQKIARDVAAGNLDLPADDKAVGVYAEILVMVENLKEHIENAQRESANAQAESVKAHEAMELAEAAGKDAEAKRDGMLHAADKLEEVAGVVSSASTELSAQIEQSERGAAEQAARVTETATAMEEMNSTVLEVAQNASMAAKVSVSTREKAEEGAKVVREAVSSIQGVQKASLALKEDMGVLNQQAQSISQIMGVISDIADQTNLLALNAAIEAARAGEAGRGFAVVADEVRKLAEKTMSSTTDVGEAIRSIQQSVDKSMLQVDSTAETIEQATMLSNKSGEALQEIVKLVDNTADQVRGIATASEQQSASSEEINQSIIQVSNIAGETSRAMQEAAQAVSDLAQQAQVLTRLIDDMKKS
ncbi:MAG: methyl-accepting chemotaxis protein [Desulfovibrionaceae bacterium]